MQHATHVHVRPARWGGRLVFLGLLLILSALGGAFLATERQGAPPGVGPPPAPDPSAAATPTSRTQGDRSTLVASDVLEVPVRSRTLAREFDAEAGDTRVVTTTMVATFTAGDGDGRALYTFVGLACGPVDADGESQFSGGTENLLGATTRTLQRTVVYSPEVPGKHRCNATFSAPSWDPTRGTAETDVTTTMTFVDDFLGTPLVASPTADEPLMLTAGETVTVAQQTARLSEIVAPDADDLDVISEVHVTACTIENGSKDQTSENLCRGDLIDRRGTSMTSQTRVEILRDGQVCRQADVDETSTAVEYLVHHRLVGRETQVPAFFRDPCGTDVRVSVRVENRGPSALLVHRGSTQVVVLSS